MKIQSYSRFFFSKLLCSTVIQIHITKNEKESDFFGKYIFCTQPKILALPAIVFHLFDLFGSADFFCEYWKRYHASLDFSHNTHMWKRYYFFFNKIRRIEKRKKRKRDFFVINFPSAFHFS